jgi:protein-disulfide isomerase
MESSGMKTRVAAVMAAFVLMTTSVLAADNTQLKPPAGARVAIVVFEDLECPSCSSAEPMLKNAEQSEKVPLVRHDFPIPQHKWSADAHVIARYFDTVSPALGEEYRHWVFSNQRSINKSNFREKTNQFATEHKTSVPLFVDPSGQLKAKVTADFNLGQQLGVSQTPTIFVVGEGQQPMQVADPSQIVSTVDAMKRLVPEKVAAKPAKSSTKSKKK